MMTLLIAGHETTAAVLTWTFHCITDRPDVVARLRQEVRPAAGPPQRHGPLPPTATRLAWGQRAHLTAPRQPLNLVPTSLHHGPGLLSPLARRARPRRLSAPAHPTPIPHPTTTPTTTTTTHSCTPPTPTPLLGCCCAPQVDTVLGDGKPSWEQVRELRYCTRVIAEAMRLYPQPPVLIR